MTTNQTIDGVPREAVAALEKARDVLRAIIRDKAAGVHYASAQAACHQINGALLDELRALLDAPYPSEVQLIAAGLGYPMSKEDAVKAYKDSLVPRTDSSSNADCEWCHGCGHDPYGEPCVGCCKPAAQPKGEPVAKSKPVAKLHAERLTGKDGEYGITVEDSQWFNTCRLTGGEFYLYAEQPAPVAVAYQYRQRPLWRKDDNSGWMPWQDCSQEAHADYTASPDLHDWQYETRTLYAGPNQQ